MATARLGPFFRTDPGPKSDWTSWAALTADPAPLGRRAAEVRAALAAGPGHPDVEPAVVASLVHLGLVGRLVAPVLGAGLITRVLPLAPAERVHLRLVGANPVPMAVDSSSAAAVDGPADLVPAFHDGWLLPMVVPFTAAVRDLWAVSQHVLDGNVVSAVASALRMAAIARPELGERSDEALDALLTSGSLRGMGRRRGDGSFERRSCCLFYRVPGAGTCGDCVLGARS